MCHICRKIDTLQGLDLKATKPIFLALSELHKHVEPRLGDLWLWRHDKTERLRKLLANLHSKVPLAPVKAILDEVNHELENIKINMVDHPPRKSTGVWDTLKTDISPSESPSVRIRKEIQLKSERASKRESKGERGQRNREGSRSVHVTASRVMDSQKELPELPGSDIHPPEARIQQSVRLVEEWFERCHAAVILGEDKDIDSQSMVSLVGGKIKERPKLEVGVWERLSRANKRVGGMATPMSQFRRKGTSITSRSQKATLRRKPVGQDYDCTYDKPSHKIDLDSRIIGDVMGAASNSGQKERRHGDLDSLLLTKKAEKLSKKRNMSVNDATFVLAAKEWREERKVMMRGARSSSPATSLTTTDLTSDHEQSSFTSDRDSVSLTASEVQKCARKTRKMRDDDSDSSFQSSSSPLRSRRTSNTNFGSVMEQPLSPRREQSKRGPLRSSRPSMSTPIGRDVSPLPKPPIGIPAPSRPTQPRAVTKAAPAKPDRSPRLALASRQNMPFGMFEDSTSSLSSRSSNTNLGSLIEVPRSPKRIDAQVHWQISPPSFSIPRVPVPIGRAKSPVMTRTVEVPPRANPEIQKSSKPFQSVNLIPPMRTDAPPRYEALVKSERRRRERRATGVPQDAKEDPNLRVNMSFREHEKIPEKVRRKEELAARPVPGAGAEEFVSEAARNRRRRRGELNTSAPDKYKSDERQRLWTGQDP
jgi:hypothetical protein